MADVTPEQSGSATSRYGYWSIVLALVVGILLGIGISRLAEDSLHDAILSPFQVDDSYVLIPRLGSFDEDRTFGEVFLVDREGTVVHEWTLPHAIAGHVELTPEGDLIYMGIAREYADGTWESPNPGEAGVLEIVDWHGDVLFTFEDPLIHHDFAVTEDAIAVLRWREVPNPTDIDGGFSGDDDSVMWGDEIIEVAPDGSVTGVWNTDSGLDPATHPIPSFFSRQEWTHANSLTYTPANVLTGSEAYLISMRQISTIAIVDRHDGQILWEYGGFPKLNQQHDPSFAESGTILVFDNGQYRPAPSASTVIEIDPQTDSVIWTYVGQGVAGSRFYSSLISGAQRLASGNTLITEGMTGRVFEVDRDGNVVWEFFNPFTAPDRFSNVDNAAVFKARAYPSQQIDRLLRES